MKLMTLLLSLIFPNLSFASGGFSNGHRVGSTFYRGQANVVCTGGFGGQVIYCNGVDFTPSSHDRFIFSKKTTAKKVELSARHEDGSSVKKSVKFDANKNESGWVNLTTLTLFQKPLLEYGFNRVSYELKNGDKSLGKGAFNVEFISLGTKTCAPSTVFVHNYNDCQNEALICDQYFNQASCN